MYDYKNRFNIFSNEIYKIKENRIIDNIKPKVSDILKESNTDFLGWITKVNVHIYTQNSPKGVYFYQRICSIIQKELTIASTGLDLDFLITYHNDGLLLSAITNYKEDIKTIFDYSCYANTILKAVSIKAKSIHGCVLTYGIGLSTEEVLLYSLLNNDGYSPRFSYVSVTDTTSIEKADYFSKTYIKKPTDNTIFMSQITHDNIIDVLKKEDPYNSKWFSKEYDEELKINYYSCNLLVTDFNKIIHDYSKPHITNK